MSGPNILVIMVDQLNGTLFDHGPLPFLHAPNLRALADESVCFPTCYTASPLCAPGRASFMSGQLPSRTAVYDNAAEFASSIPTYAHHLRRHGYHTILCGKMHYVGPDQLHGFETRTTTDIYPADFGWTPDYRKPDERIDWWYHNLGSVTGAGIAEISNQMEYDDEVAHHGVQALYQLGRREDSRPWCLTVSFTHPHDPYVARRRYWDLYEDCDRLLPKIPAIPYEQQDPHSQRLFRANDYKSFDITDDHIKNSRRAYFANISYLDDKVGELLAALKAMRMEDDTIILFCSDHGDMLGERGLWFKMSFFEGSARVPLMMRIPGVKSATVKMPVSTIDITPTLAALTSIDLDEIKPWTDGRNLLPLLDEAGETRPVFMEYAAEGSIAPLVGVRDGDYKFIHCEMDPPQLFDLANDPDELNNLAAMPEHADLTAHFQAMVHDRWDMARFDAEVRASQARRHIVYAALRQGNYYPWDYQPLQLASERYMRNHMDLNVLEESKRFPRGE
ncbi:MAG: choline-sulfatase [Alphaproteobacteria bacterium]